MATNPIGGTAAPVTLPGTFPPMPAVARILARHDRGKLAAFVTVAIDLLDVLDGDGDLEGECSEDEVSRCTDIGRAVEGDGAGCDIADAGENAWIEWHTMRGSQKAGPNLTAGREDDEDDGDAGDHSASEDDCPGIGTRALQRLHGAPGCHISDSDQCSAGDHGAGGFWYNGQCHWGSHRDDSDPEVEQMPGDVPAPHVYSPDYNLFNDQRSLLARPGPDGSVYFQVDGRTWQGKPV